MSVCSVVLFLAVMSAAKATLEQAEHGTPTKHGKQPHSVDGHHNVHFDHEAILGSYKLEQEFDELPQEEAKRRLGLLVLKMDKDADHFVSRDELTDWIVMSFRLLDEEEALEDFEEKDSNSDNEVTWEEFSSTHFGYSDKEIDEMKNEDEEEHSQFLDEVQEEKKKFNAADVNKDGKLDKSEYVGFFSPYNYEHMHATELERSMLAHDTNKDNFLSLEEFLSNTHHDKEWEAVEKDRFNDFDTNNDNKLDLEEIRPWVLSDTHEEAEEEADHLIKEADTDEDGKLTVDEILNAHDDFVGSQATDYGRHLHFVKHTDEL